MRADAVIDASGTWHSPNPAGANGLPAIGETQGTDRIAYGMPDVLGKDRARYAGKTVAVLGAGHSAIGTLTDLARLASQAPGTRPVWLLRGNNPAKAFGGGANDKLVARGELGAAFAALVAAWQITVETDFRVLQIGNEGDRLSVGAGSGTLDAMSSSMSSSWQRGSGRTWISCANFVSSLIPPSNARWRWRH